MFVNVVPVKQPANNRGDYNKQRRGEKCFCFNKTKKENEETSMEKREINMIQLSD
jgi:hypothetical protein